MTFKLKHFLLGIIFLLSANCGGYEYLPNVPVNFSIYPDSVEYINLNYGGGHEYFTGGINGIVVFRIDLWNFSAFDRACPYDWDHVDEPKVLVTEDGITLKCSKCESLYNIIDGSVIKGPTKYGLKQYYTHYDGWRLRVRS